MVALEKFEEVATACGAATNLAPLKAGLAAFDGFGLILTLANVEVRAGNARFEDANPGAQERMRAVGLIEADERPSNGGGAEVNAQDEGRVRR